MLLLMVKKLQLNQQKVECFPGINTATRLFGTTIQKQLKQPKTDV